jgi:effector-binding domain-containing protein
LDLGSKFNAAFPSSHALKFHHMSYTVQLQPSPASHLAIVRRRTSLPELSRVVPQACGDVWNAIRAQKIQGAGRNIAVYLDNEINLEIGVELDTPLTAAGDLIPSQLPTGTVATTAHFGPYRRLGEAHDAVIAWCKSQGHQLVRPSWETYGHWVEEWNHDPTKIRTDVFYLLKPSR